MLQIPVYCAGGPIIKGGDSPLGRLFWDVVDSHSVLAASLDVG